MSERADSASVAVRNLGPDWHGAHVISWIHGGATSADQEEAWCRFRSFFETAAAHGITALDAIRIALEGNPGYPHYPRRQLTPVLAPS